MEIRKAHGVGIEGREEEEQSEGDVHFAPFMVQ